VVQFVGLIAFSHLLSPRDIGLIAMLAVFLMLGETIRDFGLLQAAIQTPTLTHRQASNLFWSNAFVGVVLSSSLIIAAPAVAVMYSEPILRGLAPWIALSFTVNALQTQFQVRLARDLRFVALTVTDATSQLIGLTAGLIAAVVGAGYWSLVIQMLGIYVSMLLMRAVVAGWWPGLPRREAGMKALYVFGLHSGLSQLVNFVAYNTDSYLIGTRWGATSLGIYNRAFQMFTVPSNQLLAPLTNVALPLLSRQRHAGGDFYPLLLKAQIAISVALTAMFSLAAALARPIVSIALGPVWSESATLLSILSVGGAVQVMSYMTFWAFLASGNARQLFLAGLVTRSLLVLCIVIGSLGGLEGVAWGFTTGLTMAWFINLAWLKRCDSMPVLAFLGSGIYVLLAGLVAGVAGWVFVLSFDSSASAVFLLFAGSVLVTAIYAALIIVNRTARSVLREAIGPAIARLRRRTAPQM
jgi:PST family polysaccharide transporter